MDGGVGVMNEAVVWLTVSNLEKLRRQKVARANRERKIVREKCESVADQEVKKTVVPRDPYNPARIQPAHPQRLG